jgi:guanylate kinase
MSPLRTIFIAPPSLEELESRLRNRGTETEQAIAVRLKTARQEMASMDFFDHIIVNDQLAEATQELVNLLVLSQGQGKGNDDEYPRGHHESTDR